MWGLLWVFILDFPFHLLVEFFQLGVVFEDGQVEVEFSEGIGSQLTHARNDLDALIINLQHKGLLTIGENSIEYGVKYTHEDIRDRIQEYEIIDSAGFSIRPPIEIVRPSGKDFVPSL